MREAKEELGIEVKLTGVIRVEHTPSTITDKKTGKTYGRSRYRVIFTGEPVDPSRPLKDKPDEESDGALWLSRLELEERAAKGELRSKDFLRFVQYVDDGQPIFPLAVFAREADPLHDHLAIEDRSKAASEGGTA